MQQSVSVQRPPEGVAIPLVKVMSGQGWAGFGKVVKETNDGGAKLAPVMAVQQDRSAHFIRI